MSSCWRWLARCWGFVASQASATIRASSRSCAPWAWRTGGMRPPGARPLRSGSRSEVGQIVPWLQRPLEAGSGWASPSPRTAWPLVTWSSSGAVREGGGAGTSAFFFGMRKITFGSWGETKAAASAPSGTRSPVCSPYGDWPNSGCATSLPTNPRAYRC
jgi:hypothetical protein